MTTQLVPYQQKKSAGRILAAAASAGCFVLFLARAKEAGDGVREGLAVCSNIILPSLFCFMVVTSFVTNSGLNRLLSKPLYPITKWFFHLDTDLGCIPAMSLIGGYPIGAGAIADLIRKGSLTAETGQRMMCYCCCAAPSFVITAVGAGMFRNASTGILLYGFQAASALLLGFLTSFRRTEESQPLYRLSYPSFGEAFVQSVNSTVLAISQMCGYILLFHAVLSAMEGVLPQSILAACSGFLEVTTGCRTASSLPGLLGVTAVSFFLSFSGISVLCQIAGIVKGTGIQMKQVVLFRVLHGVLSAGISYCYFQLHPQSIPTFAVSSATAPLAGSNTPVLTACLLLMCSILLLSGLQKRRKW